jgi:RNA-directed DNA polymerase
MKNHIEDWVSYFKDIGLPENLIEQYYPHILSSFEKKIPPIFEEQHLALLLGYDLKILNSFIYGTESFYRTFKLKKRTGGTREIRAPYPSLLRSQKWINNNILKKVPLPNCVTGYRAGRSILDNARLHCNRNEMLKLDIKDFFPSIEFRRVMSVFTNLGYSQKVSFALARICCLNEKLPQGAATSPALSNIICEKMDNQFYNTCKNNGLRYTRYSDDIVISGRSLKKGTIRYFFEIVEQYGFTVNEKKVRIIKNGQKKIVTGLDITTGVPRVSRKFRRDLMQDIYFVWSVGLATHIARQRIFEPTYMEQLTGRINFWKMVEPTNQQMLKSEARLKSVYQNRAV